MTIAESIKKSVEALGIPFYYHSVGDLNEALDSVDFDDGGVAFCVRIDNGQITDENGMFHERIDVGMFFVNEADDDWNSMRNERIIDDCKKSAFKWLTTIRNDENIRLVSVGRSERVYDRFDCSVTGYGVYVTIEEISGFGACNIR